MPRVNPTNHGTEIRGYYAYHAPERDGGKAMRPKRAVHNEGFQAVPEEGYSDFNYDNPHQGQTVFTFGYRAPHARHPTPSGYDYSSIIAPGYNDPNVEPVYGIKKYPHHFKSAAKGLASLYIYDKKVNFATSDPAWNYGPVPLAKHAVPQAQAYAEVGGYPAAQLQPVATY